MKHVEPRPWLSVNFPSLCDAWNVEYHVYRGWYGEESGADLFYEIWNNAYFGEFSLVDAIWERDEILCEIAELQAGYMTRRGAFRWIFRDKKRLKNIILSYLEKTVTVWEDDEVIFLPVVEKPVPPKSGSSVGHPDKYSAFAYSRGLTAEMMKRGFVSEDPSDRIGGLSPSEAYWSGAMTFDEAIQLAASLKTIAESNSTHAGEAANILHRVATASVVTSKRR